jgi:hypothetical protein
MRRRRTHAVLYCKMTERQMAMNSKVSECPWGTSTSNDTSWRFPHCDFNVSIKKRRCFVLPERPSGSVSAKFRRTCFVLRIGIVLEC